MKTLEDKELGGKPLAEKPPRDVVETAESQRAIAEVHAAAVIADKRPRDEARAHTRLLSAIKRPKFAEDAFYCYPRSGKDIFGPSINLAREFARTWGNVLYGFRIVHDTDEERTIEAYAWDLESNTMPRSQASFKKLIQRKDPATGVTRWKAPDERDLRELTEKQAAIQMRNCVLRLAPRDVIDELVDLARGTVKQSVSKKNPTEIWAALLQDFERMSIRREQVEFYAGKKIEELTSDDIVELQGVYRAIKDGTANRDEYFPPAGAKAKEPAKGDINLDDIMGGEQPPAGDPEPEKSTPATGNATLPPLKTEDDYKQAYKKVLNFVAGKALSGLLDSGERTKIVQTASKEKVFSERYAKIVALLEEKTGKPFPELLALDPGFSWT